jgi:hypothetical protein
MAAEEVVEKVVEGVVGGVEGVVVEGVAVAREVVEGARVGRVGRVARVASAGHTATGPATLP